MLCAALLAAAPAGAAARPVVVVTSGTDPATGPDGSLAWQLPAAQGYVRRAGIVQPLPGGHPALGGPWLAYATTTTIELAGTDGSTRSVPVSGADSVAVSARWLAWRVPGPDRLDVLDLADPAATPRCGASARPSGATPATSTATPSRDACPRIVTTTRCARRATCCGRRR